MDRNLDRRIETLVQVIDPNHVQQLDQILTESFSNHYKHWLMDSDDQWRFVHKNSNRIDLEDFQEFFLAEVTND
jgi:polyphosphate kinase